MKPIVLCIMDGVGEREIAHGNAVVQANTPNLDMLKKKYGFSKLEASGSKVGLPSGQMGNSEVGHMNIGAGRVIYQPLELMNHAIEDKTFFQNEEILKVINHVKSNHSKLHIMGLLSDGGVHSHINHLLALLDMCKQNGIERLYLHLCTDGRDVDARSAYSYLSKIEDKLSEIGIGSIATIGGRYYTMDRDNNYDRLKKGYDAIVKGVGPKHSSIKEFIAESYDQDITDEFLIPTVFDENGKVEENDGFITFNFRKDRIRELMTALTNPNFNDMEVIRFSNVKVLTMLPVVESVIAPHAFNDPELTNILGECLEKNGLSQLRIAETEKYAHVTFFFDGGKEIDFPKERKILIPSPKVATYDLQPEMSAYEVTDTLLSVIEDFDVIIINYANGDMVGHTGIFDAAIQAVEVVDECIGKVYQKVEELDGVMLITADHGNSDTMLDDNDNVITSHSTSLVPFIVTREDLQVKDGKLADIAPTMLYLLGIDIPKEMTGDVLVTPKSNKKVAFLQRFCLIASLLSICFFLGLYFITKNEQLKNTVSSIEQQENALLYHLQKQVISSGDGLYHEDQNYIYKGTHVSNYVSYSGYMWRIVTMDAEGQMTLILDSVATMLAYGSTSDYQFSYVNKWMNRTMDAHSGIFSQMVDTTLLVKQRDSLFHLLSIEEYENSILDGTYLNIGIPFWTNSKSTNSLVECIDENGKRNVRDVYSILGVRPTIRIDGSKGTFSGEGTRDNPYQFMEAEGVHIGDFILYSNLRFKVIGITNQAYKLVLDEPLQIDGNDLFSFSTTYSKFLPSEEGTLAYFLNHNFYDSLDKTYLLESTWYTGEYNRENAYDYTNIYSDSVLAYVGLLQIGDIFVDDTMTITPFDGRNVYVIRNDFVQTIEVKELYTVKPCIYINKNISFFSGDGSFELPYTIGEQVVG